mgnify:CR=1 FL=1|jgi:SpoVK/Ycf46/Vps4 family AAA+-type ATPase
MTVIKLKKITKKEIKEDWDSLILSQTIKDNLERSVIWPVDNLKEPRDHGFILFGPPGTGKSTIPLSIAKKLDWSLFYISPKDFVTENNSTEFSIKKIFEAIESQYSKIKKEVLESKEKGKKKKGNAKIIFVLDEIDELVTIRKSDSDKQSRLLTTMMLTLLNDLRQDAEDCGFIFFALTNHISRFDPAIIRKGRFDLILPVGLPNRLMRYRFFELMLNNLKKDYFEKFNVDVQDWYVDASDIFHRSLDLAPISTISQRLSFGDIEIICKRVIEEGLAIDNRGFRDFLQTKQKKKSDPYTLDIDHSQFLRWINKYLVSSSRNNEDLDRYFQDVSTYTRGSSPHTELNQTQPIFSEKFESLHPFCSFFPPNQGLTLKQNKKLIIELRNLNEIDLFVGTILITLEGAGISKKIPLITTRLPSLSTYTDFISVKPIRKGTLKVTFKIDGKIIIKQLDSLNNKSAELIGSITKTISIKIK